MATMTAYHRGHAGEISTWQALSGFQLRYIYFIDRSARDRLTVPIIPFSEIDKRGAGMYKGKRLRRGASGETGDTPGCHSGEGGSTPTDALHDSAVTAND